jgi:hypothetical protein
MRAYFVRIFSSRGPRHASSTSVSNKSKRRGMKHIYLKDMDIYTVFFMFYVLLTLHLGIILANDQLDAQFFFLICLLQSSACFEQSRAHHQENQLYQYNFWYMSLYVSGRLVCRSASWPEYQTVTYTEGHISEVVLIQLIILMMRTRLLETCRGLK